MCWCMALPCTMKGDGLILRERHSQGYNRSLIYSVGQTEPAYTCIHLVYFLQVVAEFCVLVWLSYFSLSLFTSALICVCQNCDLAGFSLFNLTLSGQSLYDQWRCYWCCYEHLSPLIAELHPGTNLRYANAWSYPYLYLLTVALHHSCVLCSYSKWVLGAALESLSRCSK